MSASLQREIACSAMTPTARTSLSSLRFKLLMTYIKESDYLFIADQKQKYKELYKESFESEYKNICIPGYSLPYVHIKKEEFINCLNYMKILQEN